MFYEDASEDNISQSCDNLPATKAPPVTFDFNMIPPDQTELFQNFLKDAIERALNERNAINDGEITHKVRNPIRETANSSDASTTSFLTDHVFLTSEILSGENAGKSLSKWCNMLYTSNMPMNLRNNTIEHKLGESLQLLAPSFARRESDRLGRTSNPISSRWRELDNDTLVNLIKYQFPLDQSLEVFYSYNSH